MKLCWKCNSSALSCFVVLFGSHLVAAYLLRGWKDEARRRDVDLFLAVVVTLLHYVISYMKRYCRHGGIPEQRQSSPTKGRSSAS